MAEIFGLAVNVATVVDLFIKVGVQCSEYCAGVKAAPREVRSILNEADRLGVTLGEVKRLLDGPNGPKVEASQNIRSCVEECRLQLKLIVAKLQQGMEARGLKWPFKKGEVADIITKMERCRTSISLDLQIHQATQLFSVHQEIILAKLRTVERAGFDAHSDADNARCYPGTRTDLINQVLAWVDSDDSKTIFWLSGMAGTGKSTIARTISQELADKNKLGASFFFKRGEGDRGRAAFFFPTIATQIARQLPSLAPLVRSQVEADPSINNKALSDQFDSLIVKPIKQLPKPSQRQTLVIVVDALDECDHLDDVKRIIHLLSQVKCFSHICLKAFVTSRPELPIQLGFEDISGEYTDLVLQEIPKPIIKNDITVFLEHELAVIRLEYNKARPNKPKRLPPSWPETEQIQRLVEMAIPLFIFAATVCRFIQDRRLGGPRDQLERILERQGDRKSQLDATYLPVLDRLFAGLTESEKKGVVGRFKEIVGPIVILGSPLSSYSLARLLDIPVDTIEDQLDYLHSVLRIPPDSNKPVQLLHLSFRDFLVDSEKGGRPEEFPFWIDEHRTHSQLALDCLRLLSAGNTLKQDICNLKHPGTSRDEVDQETIEACLPPEVQYACRYWVFHWKESEQKIQDDDQVHRFLTSHLLYWLEALSLLGIMSESLLMINDLVELLHVSNGCEIGPFLRDTQRVIFSYGSVVDSWPLQIYCTVTVFAPHQSIVRKTFSHLLPNWISSPPHAESSWGACLATLEGHSASVTTVIFSPDSSWLASGSRDHTVKLWDARTGALRTTLKGHSGTIGAIASSPDSGQITSVSRDGTVKLWDTTTGACITTYQTNFSIYRAAISSDLRWVSWLEPTDCTMKLWKIGPSHDTVSFEGHSGEVQTISFSTDSSRLASGSEDRTIKLWDIETGINMATFEGHSDSVCCIAFSSNSNRLASGSDDKTVKLWDIKTAACITTFKVHDEYIRTVAFSPGSNWLASGSHDKSTRLWDIDTGVCKATYKNQGSMSYTIAFSPDSDRLASGSNESTIELWDTIGTYIETPEKHGADMSIMEISSDSRCFATVSSDNKIRLWDMTGTCVNVFEGHKDIVSCVKFSQDSKWLASGSEDSIIRLWDIAGACRATLQGHHAEVFRFEISPDSCWLVSSSRDRTIKLWDAATAICLATIEDDIGYVTCIRISPNSKWFALSTDDTVRLWDNTGACIVTLIGHHQDVEAIAISSDSKWLASGSEDKTIKLWDMTGACTATLRGHSNFISSLAFSPDSNWLASGSLDKTIKLWDTATGACVATIDCYVANRLCFKFSSDGSKICTSAGAFTLANYMPPSGSGTVADLHGERCDIGVSVDRKWVTCNSRNVLWLPSAYRSLDPCVINSMVAFACNFRGVFFITIRSPRAFGSWMIKSVA